MEATRHVSRMIGSSDRRDRLSRSRDHRLSFALHGRVKEGERAPEKACPAGFGTLRPTGATPVVRNDKGLIFQSRRFRPACRDYPLRQEFITLYNPEQEWNRRTLLRNQQVVGSNPTGGSNKINHLHML